ncbi:MAG: single-stranded DNA-binding protein [Planctomycetes bacterium]|nr:single-stranded DNA-binding protein [Planctomycetota bacterium]
MKAGASSISRSLIAAANDLVVELAAMRFADPVAHVYNPLVYAADIHEAYLRAYGANTKRVVFLGMNPGPFGMAQTGVPFGEIAAVRDWMRLGGAVGRPEREHPKRPVVGMSCTRSEVSGRRLWGSFQARFGPAERFFAEHFVANYCPLVFMEASGRNRTPDKLGDSERDALYAACDRHLRRIVEVLSPAWVVGVGRFAQVRAQTALAGMPTVIGHVLHPSPASPKANADWAGAATRELVSQGIWK